MSASTQVAIFVNPTRAIQVSAEQRVLIVDGETVEVQHALSLLQVKGSYIKKLEEEAISLDFKEACTRFVKKTQYHPAKNSD